MKINKIIAMALFVLMAISLTPFVVSANELESPVYDANNPTLGSDKQEASNPEHDNVDHWVVNATSDEIIWTYTGDGINDSVYTFDFTSKISGLIESEMSVEWLVNPTNISNNTQIKLKITSKVPEDLDAVDSDFNEVAFDIGDFTLNINGNDPVNTTTPVSVSNFFPIHMQRENQLTISNFDALINNKDTESNIGNNDKISDLKPGDSVELSITLDNDYSSREDVSIDDVEIDIICDEDQDLDFSDDNVDVGDIDANEDSDETINFDIEEDAIQDTIACTLTAIGTDVNGAVHGEVINFDIEITRDSHDIVIKEVRITPSAISCDDGSLQVAVDMINLGKKDEDEVGVQIQSIALGINEKLSNLVIDEDDTSTETFIASIEKNLAEEKYALLVSTFYDNNKQTDSVVIQIDNLCTEFVPVVEDDDNNFVGTYTNVIGLSESSISAEMDKLVSVKVELTNNENSPVDYLVSLEDLGDFATSTSSKTVHLNPGQTSTVFLNMKTNDDAEEGATYTASVVLKDASTGSILETETFTVDVEGSQGTEFTFGNIGGEDSKVFLVVLNVVLVIIAIFLIKLIFGSGKKKKSRPKKMADFEPKGSVIIKRKK
jgi:translation elongation factor EF-1beta